jgi:hypothetical protein
VALLELRLCLAARHAIGAGPHRRGRRCAPPEALWLRLGGLLLFAVATIGTSAAFTWPRGVQELVIAATLFLLGAALRLDRRRIRCSRQVSRACGSCRRRAAAPAGSPRGNGGGVPVRLRSLRTGPAERLAGASRAPAALRFAAITRLPAAPRRGVRVSSAPHAGAALSARLHPRIC